MQIVTVDSENSDVLRQKAKEIIFPLDSKIKKFLEEFQKFFASMENNAGLAAPQVGRSLRVIMVQLDESIKQFRKNVIDLLPPTLFMNPAWEPVVSEGEYKDWEACFSVPGQMGEVYRYHAIRLQAYAIEGTKIDMEVRGFLAKVLQHEIDHLDGILWMDRLRSDCRHGPIEEMRAVWKKERET